MAAAAAGVLARRGRWRQRPSLNTLSRSRRSCPRRRSRFCSSLQPPRGLPLLLSTPMKLALVASGLVRRFRLNIDKQLRLLLHFVHIFTRPPCATLRISLFKLQICARTNQIVEKKTHLFSCAFSKVAALRAGIFGSGCSASPVKLWRKGTKPISPSVRFYLTFVR